MQSVALPSEIASVILWLSGADGNPEPASAAARGWARFPKPSVSRLGFAPRGPLAARHQRVHRNAADHDQKTGPGVAGLDGEQITHHCGRGGDIRGRNVWIAPGAVGPRPLRLGHPQYKDRAGG